MALDSPAGKPDNNLDACQKYMMGLYFKDSEWVLVANYFRETFFPICLTGF